MKIVIKNSNLIIALIALLTAFSCKKECKIICDRNAECNKGQCECVGDNMIKVSNLSGGRQTSIFCEDLNVAPPVFAYKSLDSNCQCATDVYLFFSCSPGPIGGLIAPCRVRILFKDDAIGVYRQDEWDIDGFFPSGFGAPQPDLPEVFVEFGTGTGTQMLFCRGLPNVDGVAFEGKASADLDTLHLKVEYRDYVNQQVRNTCDMKMIRAGKK
jgi:hypothetical protein